MRADPASTVDPATTAYGYLLGDPAFPSDGTLPDQWKMFQPRFGAIDVVATEAEADDKAFSTMLDGENRLHTYKHTKIGIGKPNETYWVVLSGDDADHYKAAKELHEPSDMDPESIAEAVMPEVDPGNIQDRIDTAIKAYRLLNQ